MKNKAPQPKPFLIGIPCSSFNYFDIALYAIQMKSIQLKYPFVKFILIGYVPEEDNLLKPHEFEFTNPVSVCHYFKHLKLLKLDLLFIPIREGLITEDYKKFVEASILNIPVITLKQYPYSALMRNKVSGFLFERPSYFINMIEEILNLPEREALLKQCGEMAHSLVSEHLEMSEKLRETFDEAFD